MIDHNIDVQSVFSWAPKVVTKSESKNWCSCGADGRLLGRRGTRAKRLRMRKDSIFNN